MTHARHPETTLAECLAFRLLTLHHPCEGADPTHKLAPLLTLWLRRARRRSPRAVVSEVLRLASEEGARYMPAHRLALHWLFGICGVGPFGSRGGGLGWDMLLATLSCVLGYHSVVLAASPNDNGLLHQELVDFDLPETLGWGAAPREAGRTNDVARCLRPFEFAAADKRAGVDAVGRRRRELLDHWQRTRKFVLPARPPPSDGVGAAQDGHDGADCALRFGGGGNGGGGDVEACQLTPADEETGPSAGKACYAWCEGSMSQAHASVSLFHVRPGGAPPRS